MSEHDISNVKVYAADLEKDFQEDPRNANKGTQRGNKMLETSIEQFGAARSIVADADGFIPAGNKTREALIAAGMNKAIVIETDGHTPIVVKRTDWRLTDKGNAARRYAYADNRVAEVDLSWDMDAIKADFAEGVNLAPWWSEAELQGMLELDFGEESDDEAVEAGDGTATVTKLGDIWVLGDHRLVCGDSTHAEVYAAACGNLKPFIMVTDPPYGVEYDPEWREAAGKGACKVGKVLNDDIADWSPAWRLFTGDVAYVWHASLHIATVQASLSNAGLLSRSLIIWAKPSLQISRGHYHWQHEPCWYSVRKGQSARWTGDRKQSTVWQMDVVSKASHGSSDADDTSEIHGTQKPIEAMMRPIMNHGARGDVVYDPFLGSGTTIIAAERAGRRCVGVELSPEYCDAIIARFEKATGIKAVRG